MNVPVMAAVPLASFSGVPSMSSGSPMMAFWAARKSGMPVSPLALAVTVPGGKVMIDASEPSMNTGLWRGR